MADVDGTWECVVKSPLGDQKMTTDGQDRRQQLHRHQRRRDGHRSTSAGKVDGNTLTWKQSITVPMPMTLDCEATVEGDTLTGSVGAGAFGSFPMTGTRV